MLFINVFNNVPNFFFIHQNIANRFESIQVNYNFEFNCNFLKFLWIKFYLPFWVKLFSISTNTLLSVKEHFSYLSKQWSPDDSIVWMTFWTIIFKFSFYYLPFAKHVGQPSLIRSKAFLGIFNFDLFLLKITGKWKWINLKAKNIWR